MHGYIVSEKYNAVFPLPDRPAQARQPAESATPNPHTGAEYVITGKPLPLDQDSNFINNFLVQVYHDAKRGTLR